MTSPGKLQPAVLGGLFIGALSGLPVVSLGNACCCLWMVAGGIIAAWIMQQNATQPVTPVDGAMVGFLAGIIGAFVYLLLAWPVAMVMGPMMDEWVERTLEMAGEGPWRDMVERYRGPAARNLSLIVGFALQLGLGMLFSTAGGILGAMLFRKPDSPAPPSTDLGTPPHVPPPLPPLPPPPPAP